ncbi:hypothetical protein AK830_g8635 [Neonectria ditissima]|uniref:Homeobox domain-containing protein n=1 Tax=Neonectria ditissima TaxID=78410 RepID=A0A0P7BAV7_9HYPO|nr:hypothetical protein AK830_g8635 [Neonectria ditissima]
MPLKMSRDDASFNFGLDSGFAIKDFDSAFALEDFDAAYPDLDDALDKFDISHVIEQSSSSLDRETPAEIPLTDDSNVPALKQHPSPGDTLSGNNATPPPKIGARFSRQAVVLLRNWMAAHSAYPFPDEQEKDMLQRQTGLTKTQVQNWLVNARRRGKVQPARSALSRDASYGAVDIPPRRPTPFPDERAGRAMNPLERWVDSPPESEPANASAIARAMASRSATPSGSDSPHHPQPHRAPTHFLSRASSTSSLGTSQSSDNSAYSHQSRDSASSLRPFNRAPRRRKHRVAKRADGRTPLTRSLNTFQCTFCTETFTTKHIWQRHEKSLHLPLERWVCAPDGPRNTDQVVVSCVFCDEPAPDDVHIEGHNYALCQERPLHDRTFSRKDHLSQHLRRFHNIQPEQFRRPLDQWRLPRPEIRSVCGFCSLEMDTWAFRVDHLADHFKMGSTMADWKGDWGFDASVLVRVENAIPPYVIHADQSTPFPFQASKGPISTPRNAYELIKLELIQFVHIYSDGFGRTPTSEEIQLEACLILLSAEVICQQGNVFLSWLRDLIMSNPDIVRRARVGSLRQASSRNLVGLKMHGRDNIFSSCPLETQLQVFIHASPFRAPTDEELKLEASRIIQRAESESKPPAEYISAWFLELINSSTNWLDTLRQRSRVPQPETTASAQADLSEIDSIIRNYTELEQKLLDYVELLQAHGIEPDDAALRQHASKLVSEFDSAEWKQVAMTNEAWFSKFKKRHLPSFRDHAVGPADHVRDSTSSVNTRESSSGSFSPQALHDPSTERWEPINSKAASTLVKTSFLLSGDYFHRWIAGELAPWVAMTMSPNNPNRHIPSDEEIQYQARWILFDDDDPWNQTVADNAEWLQQFKVDVGISKQSVEM